MTAEIFEQISRADGSAGWTTAGQHILFSPGRGQAYAKVRLGIDQPTFMI